MDVYQRKPVNENSATHTHFRVEYFDKWKKYGWDKKPKNISTIQTSIVSSFLIKTVHFLKKTNMFYY